MICGNCKRDHDSVTEVRACYGREDHSLEFLGGPPLEESYEEQRQRAFGRHPAAKAGGPTDKQVAFIEKLVAERGYTGDWRAEATDRRSASALIDRLLSIPQVERSGSAGGPPAELEDGVYKKDGAIYKVVHAVHGSGKQYAKRLVQLDGGKWEWEYAGRKPLHGLTPADALPEEDARNWGLLYGRCINCFAPLTREESIHVGYGPTCAENNGWWYPTARELRELTAQEATAR